MTENRIVCRICGNTENNRIHRTREMMYGSREEFLYIECERCSTIQIKDIPDLSRHYPQDYYSFNTPECPLDDNLKSRLAARSARRYFLREGSLFGKHFVKTRAWITDYFPQEFADKHLNIHKNSSILDFGCGNGSRLNVLRYFGFRNLTGIDAFIEKDILYKNGVKIFKRELKELTQTFDLIMLSHSFEHLANPRETLREIHKHLKSNKYALIYMPVVSFAWKKYGVDWVQLDPPRHLFLYTEKTFCNMAKDEGFIVDKVIYDSNEFQFFGSEQYLLDIPLTDTRSLLQNPQSNIFTSEQIDEWKKQAVELNSKKEGDQACYFLRKVS